MISSASCWPVGGVPHPNESALSSNVFGVAAVANQWNGAGACFDRAFPLIRDMFADPAAGPALGVSGAYTYLISTVAARSEPVRRSDERSGSAEAQNSATYRRSPL